MALEVLLTPAPGQASTAQTISDQAAWAAKILHVLRYCRVPESGAQACTTNWRGLSVPRASSCNTRCIPSRGGWDPGIPGFGCRRGRIGANSGQSPETRARQRARARDSAQTHEQAHSEPQAGPGELMEWACLGTRHSVAPKGWMVLRGGNWHCVLVTPIGIPYCLASVLLKK